MPFGDEPLVDTMSASGWCGSGLMTLLTLRMLESGGRAMTTFRQSKFNAAGPECIAAAWFQGKPPPLDALIIGSIDESASRPDKPKK